MGQTKFRREEPPAIEETGGRAASEEPRLATGHRLLWTLLILAAAVLGWTLAVDLEIGWVAIVALAVLLVLLVLIWFRPERREPDEPPL